MQLNRTRLIFNRFRRKIFSHVKLIRFLGIFVSLGSIIGIVLLLSQPVREFAGFISQFTGSSLVDHAGTTNFLFMGVGGENHEGSDLTDSLILISLNRTASKITLISLPRDIWVTSLRAKINTAYHYGFERSATSGGILLAKSAVSEIINQPIDYVVIMDFSTFRKAIDTVGGLDINIDRSFTDERYPVAGKENDLCDGDSEYTCRYEVLRFTSGPAHLDGSTALKFVRSRYSEDEIEGTDFGRSQRQTKVITAFFTKLISPSTIRHPELYLQLYHLFVSSTITDLLPSQYSALARLAYSLRHTHPVSLGLSEPDQLDNPPIGPRYNQQWVLIPKGGNSQVIYDFVAKALGTP